MPSDVPLVDALTTRWFVRGELAALKMNPHVRPVLDVALAGQRDAYFEPPIWTP